MSGRKFNPADSSRTIVGGGREVEWTPTEVAAVYGGRSKKNPVAWPDNVDGDPDAMKAILFVGFAVGDGAKTWKMSDLVALVRAQRAGVGRDPSASFVAQRGVYRSKKGTQAIVEEDGAQVVIFPMDKETLKDFQTDMIALAEHICRQFQQEEVIVEIQRNGAVVRLMGVVP